MNPWLWPWMPCHFIIFYKWYHELIIICYMLIILNILIYLYLMSCLFRSSFTQYLYVIEQSLNLELFIWAPCSCCNEISILMIAEVILFLLVSSVPIWKHWHFQGIHLLHINMLLTRNEPMLKISCLMTLFFIYLSDILGHYFILVSIILTRVYAPLFIM